MLPIDYRKLSPIGTNEFPCMGAHSMWRPKEDKPYCYALRVGIKKTDDCLDMLVKIPISDAQKKLKQDLLKHFYQTYPITVQFENLQIFKYQINSKIIYTGTADSVQILEE